MSTSRALLTRTRSAPGGSESVKIVPTTVPQRGGSMGLVGWRSSRCERRISTIACEPTVAQAALAASPAESSSTTSAEVEMATELRLESCRPRRPPVRLSLREGMGWSPAPCALGCSKSTAASLLMST